MWRVLLTYTLALGICMGASVLFFKDRFTSAVIELIVLGILAAIAIGHELLVMLVFPIKRDYDSAIRESTRVRSQLFILGMVFGVFGALGPLVWAIYDIFFWPWVVPVLSFALAVCLGEMLATKRAQQDGATNR